MRQRRGRVDANQRELFQAMRQCGARVIDCSQCPGLGFDAVAAYAGEVRIVEIKDGSRPPSEQKLTASEVEAQANLGLHFVVLRSVDDALRMLREMARG